MSKKTTSRYCPFKVHKDVSCIFSHERAPLPHVFCNKGTTSEIGRGYRQSTGSIPKNHCYLKNNRWVSYNYSSSKQLKYQPRRKIRLIESNAKKMSLSKKMTCKGTLRQVFYLSRAPSPPMTPYSHPYTLYSVYVYTSTLVHTGKCGRS
jgi:hypothetical protein